MSISPKQLSDVRDVGECFVSAFIRLPAEDLVPLDGELVVENFFSVAVFSRNFGSRALIVSSLPEWASKYG